MLVRILARVDDSDNFLVYFFLMRLVARRKPTAISMQELIAWGMSTPFIMPQFLAETLIVFNYNFVQDQCFYDKTGNNIYYKRLLVHYEITIRIADTISSYYSQILDNSTYFFLP